MVQQLFFAHSSATVSNVDRKGLHEFAKSLTQSPDKNYRLTVVGHASRRTAVTDPYRAKEINFAIAQKRANAVTTELRKGGLKPSWVEAISKGDTEPNPSPDGKTQEEADRRVDVYMND
jgi:outer membrane protein OmpA-like peptidoglycan-associated protein